MTSGNFAVASVVSPGGTRTVLSAQTDPGGSQRDLWLGGVDGAGNTTWDIVWDGASHDRPGTALALSGGGVLFAGSTLQKATDGPTWRPIVGRLDSWGHNSCATAGGCAQKAPKDCDDGKPCTRDTCGLQGCSHDLVAAMTCSSPDGCALAGECVGGACKATAAGRLYTSVFDFTDVSAPLTAFALGEQTLSAGVSTAGQLALVWSDRWGQTSATRLVSIDAPDPKAAVTSFAGAVPMADGGFVTAFIAGGKGYARRYGEEGQVVWTQLVCARTANVPSRPLPASFMPACVAVQIAPAPSGDAALLSFELSSQRIYHGSVHLLQEYTARQCTWTREVVLSSGAVTGLFQGDCTDSHFDDRYQTAGSNYCYQQKGVTSQLWPSLYTAASMPGGGAATAGWRQAMKFVGTQKTAVSCYVPDLQREARIARFGADGAKNWATTVLSGADGRAWSPRISKRMYKAGNSPRNRVRP